MKIVIGKFSNEPFHALSKKDVSMLLKLVPSSWSQSITSVVLSSKILKKAKLKNVVEFKASSKQLTLFSRGLERQDVARLLLLTLAEFEVETEHDEAIKPYLAKFLKSKIRE